MYSILQWFIRFMVSSFLAWTVLTTVIPQALIKYTNNEVQTSSFKNETYPYLSLIGPSPIQNSTVYFIIGHPDDEVMFFAPSLIELSKPKNNNHVKLICFSNGDAMDPSMGVIRSNELMSSARILGVHSNDVVMVDSGTKYKDGMNISWAAEDITKTLEQHILKGSSATEKQKNLVVITFDEKGVSGHPNHISLYHGVRAWYKKNFFYKQRERESCSVYGLKSLNFWEKYSFTLLTNVELFVEHVSKLLISNVLKFNINISFFSSRPAIATSSLSRQPVMFYSDLNMLSVAYAAMCYGHFSQMVWFRYGWLIFSRYLTFNQLIPI